jgi:polar amino acid transport system substrate-binding protein
MKIICLRDFSLIVDLIGMFLMKYNKYTLPVVLFFILLSANSKAANHCQQLRVKGAEHWRPFSFEVTEFGQLQARGIAHDLVEIIGKELNIPILQILGVPWKRGEMMLQKGEIDVLAGNYWTEERAKKWLLSDSITSESVNIFTLRDKQFTFNSLADLVKKRGVIPLGINLGIDFDLARKNLNISEVRTHEQMYRMLLLDRVDYLVSPQYAAQQHLKKAANQQITMLANPVNSYQVHLSISSVSECAYLLDEFNRIIGEKHDDGSIKRIVEFYAIRE